MTTCNPATEVRPAAEPKEILTQPRFRTTETEDGVTLHVALPAVSKEDLKLTLLESNLRIEARRTDAVPDAWKTHRDNGVARGYRLDVRLSSRFDGSRATAALEAGVLTLSVPVREEAKPRQIQVN